MEYVVKIYAIVDVPYNFQDEKGNNRKGITRKAAVCEYDDNGDVHSIYTSKCVEGFDAPLRQFGFLDYDKYGRICRFRTDVPASDAPASSKK